MNETAAAFQRLYDIVARLRAPDGCPWDREQTPRSLRGNLIEEAYECVEAIDEGDPAHVREETGDVYLLATMIAYMHEEDGTFSVADSLADISDKLVRRHPHVFGDAAAETADQVIDQWNKIKVEQEGRRPKTSLLDEVSRALPPLERAYKLQKKAAKVGFDWPELEGVWDKIDEELSEVRAALEVRDATADAEDAAPATAHLEGELGDLLFATVNLCRYLKVDPAVALHRTNAKFQSRFAHVERRMKEQGLELSADALPRMDEFWNEAKRDERA